MLRFNFAELSESKFGKYLKIDAVFLFLVLLLVHLAANWQISSINKKISILDSRISKLQATLKKLTKIKKNEKKLLSLKDKLRVKLSVVNELERRRHVPEFLYFFSDPQNLRGIWLEQLRYDLDTLRITACTLDVRYISLFFKNIERKLGAVQLKKIERRIYKGKNVTSNYYRFNFDVELYHG